MSDLIDFLKRAKRGHYYCEDPWYSCPQAEDGCADERRGPHCDCGADAWNAEVDAMIAKQADAERSSEANNEATLLLMDLVNACTPIQVASGKIYGVRTPEKEYVEQAREFLRHNDTPHSGDSQGE